MFYWEYLKYHFSQFQICIFAKNNRNTIKANIFVPDLSVFGLFFVLCVSSVLKEKNCKRNKILFQLDRKLICSPVDIQDHIEDRKPGLPRHLELPGPLQGVLWPDELPGEAPGHGGAHRGEERRCLRHSRQVSPRGTNRVADPDPNWILIQPGNPDLDPGGQKKITQKEKKIQIFFVF